MFRRHCSDEQLLAHLDGEMSGWRRARLESHVQSCWTCRARRAALERQIHQIAEPFEEEGYPDDNWADRQIERFRLHSAESETRAVASVRATRQIRSFHRLYWGAAAAVLVAFVVFPPIRKGWKESAAQVAAAATRFDSTAAKQPLHQSFRVEVVREAGQRKVKTGQLEIWSDPAGARYSASLRQGGQLVFAAWKPKHGEEHWHGAPLETAPMPLASIASRPAAADWEELLVRWLAARRWQPISIAGELSHFLSQDGVTLRAERFRAAGETFLRLIARRQSGGTSATLTAEFAKVDYRPKLLRLRVEDASGAAEILLAAERIESGPKVNFVTAVFEPDTRTARLSPLELTLRPRSVTPHPEPSISLAPPLVHPDRAKRREAERELEVRYALHRIGACLGEPIHIEVSADGLVTVNGLVDQESRREALRKAVGELDYVRLVVQTVAEATVAANGDQGAASDPTLRGVTASGKVLIEERLASYFGQSSRAEIPRRIAALSNEATAATARLLAHAWAVRRLHAAYPQERIALLRPQSRWILEDILGDHLVAMRDEAGLALGLLEPVLGSAVLTAPIDEPESGFDESVKDVFQLAAVTDRVCRGVFGLSQLERDEQSQATSSLVENLARLRRDTAEARRRAAAEFRKTASHQDARLARDQASPASKEK